VIILPKYKNQYQACLKKELKGKLKRKSAVKIQDLFMKAVEKCRGPKKTKRILHLEMSDKELMTYLKKHDLI
jgi:hypothetical protein